MNTQTQDAHLTKKKMLVDRGIIKADPAENLRAQEGMPHGFSLNLCGHCNYRCRYCPQGVAPQPEAFIEASLVAKLFDELGRQAVYVQISARGESLLHPDFFRIIAIIKTKSPDSFICLNTNGALIDRETAARLLDAGIEQVQFSLQTMDTTLYRRMTGSRRHAEVVATVTGMARDNAERGCPMMLTAQYLDTPENRPHRKAFTDFCARLGIECHIQAYHSWGDQFAASSVDDPERYPCPYLFLYPTITHDGRVAPCFVDFYARHAYGSIARHRLAEVWRSERAQAMRRRHLEGRWDEIPMCRHCQGYRLIPSGFVRRNGRFGY